MLVAATHNHVCHGLFPPAAAVMMPVESRVHLISISGWVLLSIPVRLQLIGLQCGVAIEQNLLGQPHDGREGQTGSRKTANKTFGAYGFPKMDGWKRCTFISVKLTSQLHRTLASLWRNVTVLTITKRFLTLYCAHRQQGKDHATRNIHPLRQRAVPGAKHLAHPFGGRFG
jgi:hypothetical protein